MTVFTLDSLDLAALLCSRVCHDVISPVGAIVNGLEMLEDEKDAEMRNFALDLIKKSAQTASAKLQFCRLAFGAAGSAGAMIDTGDAENVARGLFADDKTKLQWDAARVLMAKNKVKLLLNLCLIASASIPRGGQIHVAITGADEAMAMRVETRGPYLRLASHVQALIEGAPEGDAVDAHCIQAFYTGLVARAVAMQVKVSIDPEVITLSADPMPMAPAEASADLTLEA